MTCGWPVAVCCLTAEAVHSHINHLCMWFIVDINFVSFTHNITLLIFVLPADHQLIRGRHHGQLWLSDPWLVHFGATSSGWVCASVVWIWPRSKVSQKPCNHSYNLSRDVSNSSSPKAFFLCNCSFLHQNLPTSKPKLLSKKKINKIPKGAFIGTEISAKLYVFYLSSFHLPSS